MSVFFFLLLVTLSLPSFPTFLAGLIADFIAKQGNYENE